MRLILILTVLMAAPHFVQASENFDDSLVVRSTLLNGNTGICTGVLIAPDLVLTAAHCLKDNFRHRVNRASQVGGWIPSKATYHHPNYHPEESLSAFDIGVIQLAYPMRNAPEIKQICLEDHWGEAVFRIGFGGRDGLNEKQIFRMNESNILFSTHTVVLDDPYSASGDSGGPIYAIEHGQYCLFAIHSTVTLNQLPALSYNPQIISAWPVLQKGLLGRD